VACAIFYLLDPIDASAGLAPVGAADFLWVLL
jgi:hypothetical protein